MCIRDRLNSVTSKTVPYIGKTTYDYDVVEGIENLEDGFYGEITIDPKGNKVIKIYDKVGRLAEVRAGEDITKYSYYDNGNLQKLTLSNGYSEEYAYNEDNTLKLLENKNAEGTVTESFSYTYDGAKNILTKVDCKGSTTYVYDSLNRLWKVTEPTGKVTSYLYDEAGNRVSETVTEGSKTTLNTYSYDGRNRLITITTEVVNYTYDNNGNQLSKVETTYEDGIVTYEGITTYSYDVYNQLVEINTASGVHETYTYNSEGYRDSKTSNDKVIRYLYEGDKVILEVDGDNAEKARSVYGSKLISRTINGENLYYLYNGHGDVTKLVNSEGKEVASYYYDAFGEIVESSGEADNPIRYAGYQYDEATGLYYLNARMYDPTVARFLQEDTYTGDVKDPLSLNLYTYCANNPLIYDDPTGYILQLLAGAGVGALGGLVINAGVDYLDGGKFNSGLKSYLGAAAGGAIAGAVGSVALPLAIELGVGVCFTFVLSTLVTGVSDFLGSAVEQKISTGKVSVKQAFKDAGTSAVLSVGGSAIGQLGKKLKIFEGAKSKLVDLFKSKSSKKIDETAQKAKEIKSKKLLEKQRSSSKYDSKSKSLNEGGSSKEMKIKTSTLFQEAWSDNKIIESIKTIGDTPSIGVRSRDGATLHRGIIDGVQVEVIKIGNNVTSGYPTGGGVSELLTGFK